MSSSKMSETLLGTLNAITARDEVLGETAQSQFDQMTDKETGEWMGPEPEGYKPLEAPELKVENKETAVQDFEHSDARTDYIRVRDTTYALQEVTMHMLGEAAKLATNTESPRAFSVFKEMGELMRGLNKDLMENAKNFKTITQGSDPKTDVETDITVETDGNGNTRVSVGKTQRRSSRDLMEVARALQAEQEKKAREEQEKKSREQQEEPAQDAEIVEETPNVPEQPAAD